MTQLVGALCDNRKQVVLVSDRMVTAEDFTLGFEHEPKFEFMAPNALLLTAGTIHEPELVEDAKALIAGRASIRQTAEHISEVYRRIRKKRIEDEILGCYGLSSFDDFYQRQRLLHEDTNLQILRDMEHYGEGGGLGAEFILGGVDDRKAHLYRIADPGTYRSYDTLGYCCVGIGNRHAEPVFAFLGFRPSMKVSEVLQIAHTAKKRAELAGGIGRETDAWIINKEGCYEILRETIAQLDNINQSKELFSQFRTDIEVKTQKLDYPPNETRVA
jgi:hypothetical protein